MNPRQTPANHRKASRLQEMGGVDQSAMSRKPGRSDAVQESP